MPVEFYRFCTFYFHIAFIVYNQGMASNGYFGCVAVNHFNVDRAYVNRCGIGPEVVVQRLAVNQNVRFLLGIFYFNRFCRSVYQPDACCCSGLFAQVFPGIYPNIRSTRSFGKYRIGNHLPAFDITGTRGVGQELTRFAAEMYVGSA